MGNGMLSSGATADAAVKILKPLAEMNDREFEWLEREVLNQAILEHENVCRLFEVGLTARDAGPQRVFMVLEYVPGGTLHEFLENHFDKLSVDDKRSIFFHVVLALQHCHAKKVFHRDVKPGNCLLTKMENGQVVLKVADFGFSKSPFAEQGPLSSNLGSGPFKAPEVESGLPYAGEPADVFSSGVTLYQLIFNTLPFICEGNALINLNSRTGRQALYANKMRRPLSFPAEPPNELRELLEGMLQPVPDKRLSVEQVLVHRWVRGLSTEHQRREQSSQLLLSSLAARAFLQQPHIRQLDEVSARRRERLELGLAPIRAAYKAIQAARGNM
ncbi:hypothetical protein HYH03_014862 [Edaphochlamys debaryana]|uniref:Protein kinase domain-containing protein n=1 Tax=Edaphochlamys debaryana TaxID=47281 RepID=A0A836BRQ1_9CHLO|nr:hypothetical protein HYH03_014862 [Edaphochlamys debaryana]|eukprot:KAG2486415.1 hypothetical protein HYH03_014862 [Edaphochlamys debaryana]